MPGDYKQKLAIIPFENLNEDEGDGLLVDGIVEDLITGILDDKRARDRLQSLLRYASKAD